jgi:hypothetical protein
VTEADDVLFGRAELERAFTALGERLARRGIVADVFVVGGAARARDIDDLRLLADVIGVESTDEALQICADFYPDEPVPQRSVAVLRELFG